MTPRRQGTAEFKAQVILALLAGANRRAPSCRAGQLASSGLADGKA
jgi:hypothetical protein